jgi:colanic acid/amylovoran biosynthesis glycosyltransferase
MNTSISEALATGLPVVATRHSGFPDQVKEGVNGYLANEADPADFAEKILEYMVHPERWGAMSDAARAHSLAHYDRQALIGRQIEYYRRIVPRVKKIAFVVGIFPVFSETFIINQVADLIDRGVDVRVYTFRKGSTEHVSERYQEYKMAERTILLDMPASFINRFFAMVPKFLHLLYCRPSALLSAFDVVKYRSLAYSGKLLFWLEPFIDFDADIVHCHFGTIANHYLTIKKILDLPQPIITTFYGIDVSQTIKQKGEHHYDLLRNAAVQFFTMSQNMKERILPLGFDPKKVEPLPVSVDVEGFPFSRRSIGEVEMMHIVSVGRFVEKKGFDDLLRVAAILKKKAKRPFVIHIIGGGILENELKQLAKDLDILDVVHFEGFMKVQDVVQFLTTAHLFVQSSRTARDGDME